ncbi:hypothetical protein M0802_001515 [Mischocyttarus mexicanus]|nr:hypothetical protein M0802_001515 [Mischocyttarus mexicanus]
MSKRNMKADSSINVGPALLLPRGSKAGTPSSSTTTTTTVRCETVLDHLLRETEQRLPRLPLFPNRTAATKAAVAVADALAVVVAVTVTVTFTVTVTEYINMLQLHLQLDVTCYGAVSQRNCPISS